MVAKPSGFVAVKNSNLTENKEYTKRDKVNSPKVSMNESSVTKIFGPFLSVGKISLGKGIESEKSIQILRDTGASQSLILDKVLPFSEQSFTGKHVIIQGIGSDYISIPIHNVHLDSKWATGNFELGVISSLPFAEISLLLGNDIAGGVVDTSSVPTVTTTANSELEINNDDSTLNSACAVTRSMRIKENSDSEVKQEINLTDTFIADIHNDTDIKLKNNKQLNFNDPLVKSEFMNELHSDEQTSELCKLVVNENEICKLPNCSYMKETFDKNAVVREFQIRDRILAFLPMTHNPLGAKYFSPYIVSRKINDLNYVINTHDRRKSSQLCHINMLKRHYERDDQSDRPVNVVTLFPLENASVDGEPKRECEIERLCEDQEALPVMLNNSDVLKNIDTKLEHLSSAQKHDIINLLAKYMQLFTDIPGRTNVVHHDVVLTDNTPSRQHPYRLNLIKQKYLDEEIDYLLKNGFIEPSCSEWSSSSILVLKPDSTHRLCTDYRNFKKVTKADSYPISRIEDCIDHIGQTKYVTRLDLLKGFWQIPLTERDKEIPAFVTNKGLYQYKVGMRNSSATFQRMINMITKDLEGCESDIDDFVLYHHDWGEHVQTKRALFGRLDTRD